MSFPILQEYQKIFPACEGLLSTIPELFTRKFVSLYADCGTS